MTDSTLVSGKLPTNNSPEPEKCKNNSSTKSPFKFELKSSIPKPTPYVRIREGGKVLSSSSYHCQPMNFSKIPLSTYRSASRGKTSASLQYRAASMIPNPSPNHQKPMRFQSKRAQTRSASPKIKPTIRPMSASTAKNPYSNVKAKVDSKLPKTNKLKKHLSPTNVGTMKLDESNAGNKVASCAESDVTDQSMEEKTLSHDEILEKQRQLLSIYNELRKVQPARDLQPLEREICQLMQNKTLGHLDNLSRENSFLLNEGSPEFLSTFEKQMQEVSESWLQLMCDLISSKLSVGNPALARLSLPDPTLNLREEIYRFLTSFPSDAGEPLHGKLKKVEEEQLKVMTVVMHSVMALCKQHEDLKDKHFRLEKTQDQIHYELKEEIAILGEENKELDRKYSLAVEKYNLEKAKVEQQEKHKMNIQKDMSELKRIMKFMEGKCIEWENKVKKMDAVCRTLEVAVRNKEVALEKEGKHNRELIMKFNESKDSIKKLKSELEESNRERISLEMVHNELKDELVSIKASFDENLQKRNELVEELSSKTKKLNETEVELDLIRTYVTNSSRGSKNTHDITSNVLIEDLTKDIHQRNLQIQELKKKLNHMEHILKEKSTREDMLMRQVTELQNQPHEQEVSLKTKIKELHYVVKDLTEEKSELEKIIAQKTLELDQRDLLMKEHSKILRSRDDLIPMIQNKQRNDEECIERLRAVVFEQEKMYFNQGSNGFFNQDEPNLKEAMRFFENRNNIDPKMVDKELTFRQEKMTELFNLLENKQMEMMRLERRLRELQGVKQEKEIIERENEARIASLQKEIKERKAQRSRGFFSLFSGQDVPSY